MKIYISADLEGISGVVHPEQTILGKRDYSHGRKMMIKEVNAAVEGALAGGAEVVLVGDAHGHQFSILPEELHPKALLVTGNQKPISSMLEGLDESFGGVFFIGYHARSGIRKGVLNHTYFPKEVQTVRLNGIDVGELGVNAALAGYYNAPVRLVTGDQAAVDEALELFGGVLTISTKEGLGRYSAICRHPQIVRHEIRQAAQKAVSKQYEGVIYRLDRPVHLEIHFSDSAMADAAALMPDVERLGDRGIAYSDPDYLKVYKLFRASLLLANTAYNIDY